MKYPHWSKQCSFQSKRLKPVRLQHKHMSVLRFLRHGRICLLIPSLLLKYGGLTIKLQKATAFTFKNFWK